MGGKRTTFWRGRSGSWMVAGPPVTVDKIVLRGLLGCDLLELFFRVHLGLHAEVDRLLRNDASFDLRACLNFEHGVQEDVLDNALLPPPPRAPPERLLGILEAPNGL